jgi:HD-like signal output (HDOD) protein
MAGFLHEVGTLVLAQNRPDEYFKAQTLSRSKQIPMWKAEIETFGSSHAEIAAYLLSLWGLPSGVVDAVAWCHRPSLYPVETLSPIAVVHVAHALEDTNTAPGRSEMDDIDNEMVERLQLADKIELWRQLSPRGELVNAQAA